MLHQVRDKNTPKNRWDIAPAEHEIYSMRDEIRPMYRNAVEQYISGPNKSLYKKPFFTISTNVLGIDIDYTRKRNPSVSDTQCDIYLPLEIAITKWSIRDAKLSRKKRKLETRHWIINPGKVHYTVAHITRLHNPKHKIIVDDIEADNHYVEDDLQKIGREINSFLTADRVVFSQTLRHVRQDLGSLKWLNNELQYHNKELKPISVLSLVDLYVLLIRKVNPDMESMIGEGIAKYRLDMGSSFNVCQLHKDLLETGEETQNCCQAVNIGKTHRILDDLKILGELFMDEDNI